MKYGIDPKTLGFNSDEELEEFISKTVDAHNGTSGSLESKMVAGSEYVKNHVLGRADVDISNYEKAQFLAGYVLGGLLVRSIVKRLLDHAVMLKMASMPAEHIASKLVNDLVDYVLKDENDETGCDCDCDHCDQKDKEG